MKSLKEVGLKKALKFLVASLIEVFYHQVILHVFYLPQFRRLFFKLFGAKIGKDTILMNLRFFNLHHKGLGGFEAGKECFIGDEVLIDLYDKVILEDQVTIAQRVTILTHLNVGYKNHPLQKYFPKISKQVVLKRGCVVGASSTILPGVTIGRESFVASGSVVTKDVPERTLVAGIPAKVVKKLN